MRRVMMEIPAWCVDSYVELSPRVLLRVMKLQRDGASLYSLSPESLDWVCEAPRCGDFLDWLLASVTRDNVLEDAELEAYSAIPEEERLSGQILSEALSTFGDTNTRAQMTDAELEKQVNSLL